MERSDVCELLDLLAADGIRVWVDGGWAVDALLGEQTRCHTDLDIAIEQRDVPRLTELLGARGFHPKGEPHASPINYVVVDDRGRELDLHIITLDERGNGVYGSDGGANYTHHALSGRGRIGDREVCCIAAEALVGFHTGYEFDADDIHDVKLLCERFGIPLPAEYADHRAGGAVGGL